MSVIQSPFEGSACAGPNKLRVHKHMLYRLVLGKQRIAACFKPKVEAGLDQARAPRRVGRRRAGRERRDQKI